VLLQDDPTLFSKEVLTLSLLWFEVPWLGDRQVSLVSAREEKKVRLLPVAAGYRVMKRLPHGKIHQQSDQQPESRKGMNSIQRKKNKSILTLLV